MWAVGKREQHGNKKWPAGRAFVQRMHYWLQRFLSAELLAGLVATICATLADALSNDDLLMVVVSIVGSTASYYGLIVIREIVQSRRAPHGVHMLYTLRDTYLTVRNLALEFGSAELLDSLLFSPVLLYVCIQVVPNLQL